MQVVRNSKARASVRVIPNTPLARLRVRRENPVKTGRADPLKPNSSFGENWMGLTSET